MVKADWPETDSPPIPTCIDLQTSAQGPQLLYDAFARRALTLEKLRDRLPYAWCYHSLSAPEGTIGSARWVEMFLAVDVVTWPTSVAAPACEQVLFRGCDPSRQRGMAWTSLAGARHYRDGRLIRGHPAAHVYSTVASVEAVLAVFQQGADDPEYLLDPGLLGAVELIE